MSAITNIIQSNPEDVAFIPDSVTPKLYDLIEDIIGKETFADKKVSLWLDLLCQRTMEELNTQIRPYKYIVTGVIMQNNGAGLHSANSCFYDCNNDNVAQVNWPSQKRPDKHNCRMICILTVCGMSI